MEPTENSCGSTLTPYKDKTRQVRCQLPDDGHEDHRAAEPGGLDFSWTDC